MNHAHHRTSRNYVRRLFFGGIGAQVVQLLNDQFVVPFAIFMKASTTQLGLLVALPNVAAALAQLHAGWLMHHLGGRRHALLFMATLQAIFWVSLPLSGLISWGDQVSWLIGFYVLVVVFGSLATTAENSLAGDLVPRRIVGRFFGKRAFWAGAVAYAATWGASVLLELPQVKVVVGFALIFCMLALFRFSMVFSMAGIQEPKKVQEEHTPLSHLSRQRNLEPWYVERFLAFAFLMTLALGLLAPFFAVYVLQSIHASYTGYVFLNTVDDLTAFVTSFFWARKIDREGSLKVLFLSSALFTFAPLFWVFSTNIVYLTFVQIVLGFAFGGLTLGLRSFLLGVDSGPRLTRWVAWYQLGIGLSLSMGALLSSQILLILPFNSQQNLLAIFILSGLMRGLLTYFLLPTIKEVRSRRREVQSVKLQLITSSIRPMVPGIAVPSSAAERLWWNISATKRVHTPRAIFAGGLKAR